MDLTSIWSINSFIKNFIKLTRGLTEDPPSLEYGNYLEAHVVAIPIIDGNAYADPGTGI